MADELVVEDIHRHPRIEREQNGGRKRPRILKVSFRDKKSRDTFLFNFRKAIVRIPSIPKSISVRRDMTQQELSILYELRKQAYLKNQAEGLFKYVVVDLSIITLKNPHPLRTKNNIG